MDSEGCSSRTAVFILAILIMERLRVVVPLSLKMDLTTEEISIGMWLKLRVELTRINK